MTDICLNIKWSFFTISSVSVVALGKICLAIYWALQEIFFMLIGFSYILFQLVSCVNCCMKNTAIDLFANLIFFLRSPVMVAHLKLPGKAVKSPSSWFLLTLNFPKTLYSINKLHHSLAQSALLISSLILGGLQKRWPYLFCKGQDCKYCKVCGLHGLCHNYSTVPF